MKTSTNVKCNVDACTFHDADHCTAESIKVAGQAGMLSGCSCSSETECSTFKKK